MSNYQSHKDIRLNWHLLFVCICCLHSSNVCHFYEFLIPDYKDALKHDKQKRSFASLKATLQWKIAELFLVLIDKRCHVTCSLDKKKRITRKHISILSQTDLRINNIIHWQQVGVILETFDWSYFRLLSKTNAETQRCLTFSRSLSLPSVFLKYPDD